MAVSIVPKTQPKKGEKEKRLQSKCRCRKCGFCIFIVAHHALAIRPTFMQTAQTIVQRLPGKPIS
jgi:hypothetical protein